MAYFLESKDLDLKKSYQNFSYESLVEKGKVINMEIETEEPKKRKDKENPYEGIS